MLRDLPLLRRARQVAALRLPVPPAFVLPIPLGVAFAKDDDHAKKELASGLSEGLAFLENATGKKFGDRRNPLLVSVRSGAARSMPGMLDTVLNVGCSLSVVRALVRATGNPRFAWDCRRRFLESFGGVVLGLRASAFARALAAAMTAEGVQDTDDLDSEATERLAVRYRQAIEGEDCALPEDPMEQLTCAAQAVYRSWTSERARTYRKLQHLESLAGTAVTIQAMVFGNRGSSSAAGVAFSRDPSTGAPQPVIEVLFDSQGEDVVSGGRTPDSEDAITRRLPAAAAQLRQTLVRLEQEFADVQDVEFTIEDGKLWVLQTRSAKRTPRAALRFAIDFVKEGRINPAEAVQVLKDLDLASLARARLTSVQVPAAQGIGASAGVAVGRAAFNAESARRLAASGEPVILVRRDTSTADVAGFAVAAGIVTSKGGRTAHAALVARQLAKPCIVGCASLILDGHGCGAQLAGSPVREGDWLSIDGETGAIYLGRCEVSIERPEAELAELGRWRSEAA